MDRRLSSTNRAVPGRSRLLSVTRGSRAAELRHTCRKSSLSDRFSRLVRSLVRGVVEPLRQPRDWPTTASTPAQQINSEKKGSFPSGQRGLTVNQVAMPSQVRILHSPVTKPTQPARPIASAHSSFNPTQNSETRMTRRGCSSMVELLPSKQRTRVRFPSPALPQLPPLQSPKAPAARPQHTHPLL